MPEDISRELDRLAARKHNIKPRELEQAAKDAGYRLDRVTGSHAIYEKEGARDLSIPRHPGAMNGYLAGRIIANIRDSL